MAIAGHEQAVGTELTERERAARIAWLLGITPERLDTIRRVHDKARQRKDGRPRLPNLPPRLHRWWRRLEEMDDAALCDELRLVEGLARPRSRFSHRSSRSG